MTKATVKNEKLIIFRIDFTIWFSVENLKDNES